jgi:hypothetical protein
MVRNDRKSQEIIKNHQKSPKVTRDIENYSRGNKLISDRKVNWKSPEISENH